MYTDPYAELPLEGAQQPDLGHALITLVEPDVGAEREYNRWYEDDHFISGMMDHPWVFSGRRWVATADLQRLRLPAEGGFVDPMTAGCYLATYWLIAGRNDDHWKWTVARNKQLTHLGRQFSRRRHVYTAYHDHVVSVYRDAEVPRDVFALVDPSPGLVLQIVDADEAAQRSDLAEHLATTHLPSRVTQTSPVRLATLWAPHPPDPDMKEDVRRASEASQNGGRRLAVLWFLDRGAEDAWPFFRDESVLVGESGLGRTSFIAAFKPSRMGTDRYVDELRA